MSSNTTQIVTGSFVSTGNPINIVVPSNISWFEVLDVTQAALATSGSTSAVIKATWTSDMPAGAAYVEDGNGATPSLLAPNYITSNGFTPFTFGGPEAVGATHTGTTITKGSSTQFNSTTTVPVGSIVRILNPVSMEQISGWDFYVTSSSAGSSFTTSYLNSSAFANNGGAFSFVVINPYWAAQPQTRLITNISAASSAVITLSMQHSYAVGQLVRIKCPNAFGMSQIANLVGQITATTVNTITVNINSSSFTAFSFPTSATAAAGVQFPMVVPIGEFPNTTGAVPFDNGATMGITLGSNVCGVASDQMFWKCLSGVAIS